MTAHLKSPTAESRGRLLRYAHANRQSTNGALAFFGIGTADLAQGKHQDAIGSLEAARPRLPQLADWIDYSVAYAYYGSRDYPAAIETAHRVLKHRPVSPLTGDAAVLLSKAHRDKGEPAAALQVLLENQNRVPATALALERALNYEAAGDLKNAAVQFQRVYFEYPLAKQASEASAGIIRLQSAMGADYPPAMPASMLTRANALLEGKDYGAAREEYQKLIPQLTGKDQEIARVRLGAASHLAGRTSQAYEYLRGLSVSSPEADAERLYYLTVGARRLDRTSEFLQWASQAARHTGSEWAHKAVLTAGDHHLLSNEDAAFDKYYRACYEGLPSGSRADYCHWKVTWKTYLRRSPEAGNMLREHLAHYADGGKASAALYFLGRLAEQERDIGAAKVYYQKILELYANYYHAALVRARLQEPAFTKAPPSPAAVQFLHGIPFPERKLASGFQLSDDGRARIQRFQLLSSAGMQDLGERELRFGAVNDKGQGPLYAIELAESTAKRGSIDQAVRLMKRHSSGYLTLPVDSAPSRFWELLYPMPYKQALVGYSKANGLDPHVVAGLIRQESEFNASAISRAKAYGLTQVLPSTGRQISRNAGIPRFSTNMLLQPDTNIRLGTHYLKTLLNLFDGQTEMALASYNAGKSRVDKWLTWHDFQEPAEFVETIPFSETRNYVQLVMGNASVYRQVYGAETQRLQATATIPKSAPVAQQSAPAKPAAKKAAPAKPVAKRNAPATTKRAARPAQKKKTSSSNVSRLKGQTQKASHQKR